MKYRAIRIWFLLLFFPIIPIVAQNNSENLETALVYKIANCIIWPNDTTKYFVIGVYSNNHDLITKFEELSALAQINKRKIKVKKLENNSNISAIHLIYTDERFIYLIPEILHKIAGKNILLISKEYNFPGELMVNIKTEKNSQQLTFEYNRANILFQGLNISDEIVVLKGSEIEIRELYLQARRLWDQQKRITDSLKNISETQNRNIEQKRDSLQIMQLNVFANNKTIQAQEQKINEKDSISSQLNYKIFSQQNIITENLLELEKYKREKLKNELILSSFKDSIQFQKIISDNLTSDIISKKNELSETAQKLNIKESIINKQSNWLIISIILITLALAFVLFIFKAYYTNKKARIKIAQQKDELELILEKLKNTQQQLIHSEKMASIGVLVSGIAHEINNPINFINSGITGIEKILNKILKLYEEINKIENVANDSEFKKLIELKDKLNLQNSISLLPEVIQNIKLGIERTIQITNGLRQYARMDKESKTPNDINQIIETALLLLRPQYNNKIDIEKKLHSTSQIQLNSGKISQVIVNLLSNAIDSIFEKNDLTQKPTITIETKEFANFIEVIIEDNGKGINPEIMDKLFDPFFTTKQVGKGTGLGLSVSQSIIEEHNGTITAKNSENGAKFLIKLPKN